MRILLASAALAALATGAFAQNADVPAALGQGRAALATGAMFERLDVNGDGFVDQDEWAQADEKMARSGRGEGRDGASIFERTDADKDGRVSRAEWAAAAEKVRGMRGGERPKPGEMAEKAFEAMDTNTDGALSREEFRAGMEAMRARHERRGEGRADRPKR